MCGICGYTKFNHSIEKNISEMLKEIENRGPDFRAKISEKYVSLAHSRLSIIDLSSKANQPFVSKDLQYTMVYNGEIYNYKTLKNKLEREFGVKFRTNSDTEVVLEGFIHLKNKIFNELDGMFALAIWDKKNSKLTLARDVFGEKPLFYFNDKNDIFFASDLKSLSKAPTFNAKISSLSLKSFLNNNYVNSRNKTIYDSVFKVEPGTYLEFQRNNSQKTNFYSFKNFYINANNDSNNFTLDKIIEDSVHSRMVSDTEGGVFLSGGLDSSLIAYHASKFSKNLKCFTLGFNEASYDETEKAQYVSNKLKVDHHIYYLNENDVNEIDKVILSTNEPFADTSIISNYFLSKFSRNYVKFCLGGDGADEIFSGYDTYDATYVYKYIRSNKIYANIFNFLSKFSSYLLQKKSKVNLLYKVKKFLEIYDNKVTNPHLLWRQIHNDHEIKDILDKDFFNEVYNPSLQQKFEKKNDMAYDLNTLNISDMESFLSEDILVKTDRTSMANGLEVRSPYLNLELIKNVLNIKENQRYRLFDKKKIFKELLRERFGSRFVNQKKRGFNTPVSIWFKKQFHDKFIEIVNDDKSFLFDKKMLLKLLEKHQNSGNDHGNRLFNIMCLLTWVSKNKINYE